MLVCEAQHLKGADVVHLEQVNMHDSDPHMIA